MWPFEKKPEKELKPCPFCGENWYVRIMEPEGEEKDWVVGCFAQQEGGCGFTSDFTSRQYAIEAWNKRV